ncbi:MAG: DUF4097 family beta strand repeat protein [Opitutae bacterium]|nr:DUF4097 family beta strand repeat protein [Opitutae bacterium]
MNPARLLLLPALLILTVAAHATVTENFSRSYPLTADGTVSLDTVNGDIEITGWDRPEVRVEAVKRARNADELKRLEILIDASPTRLALKTRQPKNSFGFFWFGHGNARGEVRYKLMVPAGARLQKIDSVNADITVTGVRGPVDLDTVNGRIRATGLAADGRFDTVNGSITASYDTLHDTRRVVLDTVNGSCTLRLPPEATGRVKADTVNGRIVCDFPIRLESSGRRSLRGVIGEDGPDLVLDSVNGSLRLEAK